ncbi:rhodanese-like domain-containing protein [Candidatus Bathyarchaeota archaeon]|nr:rhodanese-like domain-containing protein [Candidatus Bathyarchaeota archaeon]
MNLIVNVRGREEYVQSRIKGAINIPLFDLKYHLGLLKGKKVLLYCNMGHRSKMAAEYLRGRGIDADVISPSIS